MINKLINLILIGGLTAVCLSLPAFAGTPHTSWGSVTNGQTTDRWTFYAVSRPTEKLTSNLRLVGSSNVWQASVGNLATPWANGDDSIVYVARESNAGIATHAGSFAVMNEDLSVTRNPQQYANSTIRAIPIPTVTGTAGTGKVDLTWTAPTSDTSNSPARGSSIAGYNIYRSTSQASGFTKINSALVATISYSDSSGTAGTTYYYAIEPVFRGGVALGIYSANSTAIQFPTGAPAITSITWDTTDGSPGTPVNENLINKEYVYGTIIIRGSAFGTPTSGNRSNANFNVTIGGIKLSETIDVSGNSGTQIYSWEEEVISCGIPNTVTANTLNVLVTANGQTSATGKTIIVRPRIYDFNPKTGPVRNVVTINGTGFGTDKNKVIVGFGGATAIATSAQNTLAMVEVPTTAVIGQNAVQITMNGLQSNTKDDAGNDLIFTVTQAPATPTGLAVSNVAQTAAKVSWTAVTGAISYTVSYGTDAAAANKGEIIAITAANKDLPDLTVNTKYYWKVKAVNAAGDSAYSTIENFTTLPATPATPVGLSETNIIKNSTRVSWNAVSGATSYAVSYGTDTSASNKGEVTGITDAYKDLSNLTAETKYYWKVKAVNAGGSSAYSTIDNFTTLAEAPTISKVYNKKEGESENWVYVTNYDPNWTGTPEDKLNLIINGANFGERNSNYQVRDNESAPAGGSVAVKPYGSDNFIVINDDPTNPPDRMYWWQRDEIEIGVPSQLGNASVVAGAAKVKVTTTGGSIEESFNIRPQVYGITSHAKIGETVKITGTAFGSAASNVSVKFASAAPIEPKVVTGTTVEVVVPADAASGNVIVTVNGQSADGIAFTVDDSPVLDVSPSKLEFTAIEGSSNPAALTLNLKNSGSRGTLNWSIASTKTWVTLSASTGTAVSGDTSTTAVSVNLDGLAAGVHNATLSVTSNGGSKDVPIILTINAPQVDSPVILGISSSAAPAGASLKISGANFGSVQGRSAVSFDNTVTNASYQAEIIAWGTNEITALVPKLAASGTYEVKVSRIAITAGTLTASESNTKSFQVSAAAAAETAAVYPNPFNAGTSTTNIVITNPGGATNLGYYLYDMTGSLVYKKVVAANQIAWDGISQYGKIVADGVYLLRVVNEDTKTLIAKGKVLVVKR